jgi:electron transfer flavoprotein alpha subunit
MSTLVYCESSEGRLSTMSTEILGGGRELADALGHPLLAVLVGQEAALVADEAIAFGADIVYILDHPLLSDYQPEAYAQAIEQLITEIAPKVVIFGQTDVGRDLAPRLAFSLATAAVLGCTEVKVHDESKRLLQTRPVYGGNAEAVFSTITDPQILTVQGKSMMPLARDDSRKGQVLPLEVSIDESRIKTRLVQRVKEVEGIKLEDASVVVSGGRGIGSKEGFQMLDNLASILKGTVGASRPPCDGKLMPSGKQIGLTGKVVAPELYIAVAISGATHHLRGCASSKAIVAINRDPEANIFRHARFGVVGDWRKVLDGFTMTVKALPVE